MARQGRFERPIPFGTTGFPNRATQQPDVQDRASRLRLRDRAITGLCNCRFITRRVGIEPTLAFGRTRLANGRHTTWLPTHR